MADSWQERSQILGDVVFFEYVTSKVEASALEVYVWDLDKTYLDTHFETLRGLVRTIREKAFQKRNVPGTGSLVRAITGGRKDPFPIFFITASPPQLEKKIHEKLEIDRIHPYGVFCKDNLKNLTPKRFRRLTQQVGYKLQALMQLRTRLGENVKQILWGDDSESDAIIYSLYSDVCARRLSHEALKDILQSLKVTGSQMQVIFDLQAKVPAHDPVAKIYINLASDTDAEYYAKFGRRVLATFNTFQIAVDLYQEGRLSEEKLVQVAHDMSLNYGFTPEILQNSFQDMLDRKCISQKTFDTLVPLLQQEAILSPKFKPVRKPVDHVLGIEEAYQGLSDQRDPWVPEFVDYLNDFR